MPNESSDLLHFLFNGSNTLSIPAQPEYFSHFESWIDEICDTMNIGQEIRAQLQIAVDEIFTNICSYAYPEKNADSTLSLASSFHQTERMLELTFSDHGIPFDPLKTPPVSNVRTRRRGGVGLLLVRNFADSLKYERRGNHNVLTFLKKI